MGFTDTPEGKRRMAIHTLTMYGLDAFQPIAGTQLAEFGEEGISSFLDIGDRMFFRPSNGTAYTVMFEGLGADDMRLREGGDHFLTQAITLRSPYTPRTSTSPTIEYPGPEGLALPAGNRIGPLYQTTFVEHGGTDTYTLAGISLDFDDKSPISPNLETTHVIYWLGDVPPENTQLRVTANENGGSFPVCFASGTRILTPRGPVAVEDLRAGDPVITLDHGVLPVRWAGHWHASAAQIARNPRLAPIRFAPGALGGGAPLHPLLVSRQHRMMVASPIVQRMFGVPRCLVPASAFEGAEGIGPVMQAGRVHYHHLLLDRHAVIIANGAPCETLWLGPVALGRLSARNRADIAKLGAAFHAAYMAAGPALRFPPRPACKTLMRRHIRNARPFLPPGAAMIGQADRALAACAGA